MNDYKEVKRESKDGWTIIHQVNSSGRRRILEKHPDELDNVIYPDGGCSRVKGMLLCSFNHIDWSVGKK